MSLSLDQKSRMLGGLWGSLVGDALGVPVEFQNRAARVADPVTGMRAYGTHRQPAGTWSDDGALLLCSVESLVERGFNTEDMGRRFLQWHDHGLWTANGDVFDIGIATSQALRRIRQGIPVEQAGGRDQYSNGNGSLMRILPVALHALPEETGVFRDRLHRASAITHGHSRSQMACVFFGLMVRSLMDGCSAAMAHRSVAIEFGRLYEESPELELFRKVLMPNLAEVPEIEVNSGGYVIETLHASVWCLLTTGSYAECVLQAVNLGSDTDTTGCVAGGLAGLLYGEDAIPEEWREALPRQEDLAGLFDCFVHLCSKQSPRSKSP